MDNEVEIYVFSSTRHLKDKIDEHQTLKQYLQKNNIKYFSSADINQDQDLAHMVDEQSLGISFSAPWIFKKNTIDLFNGKLVNLHQTKLPEYGGGGGFSWQIMGQSKIGCSTIHLIDQGVDTGNIIATMELNFPDDCQKPIERINYMKPENKKFVSKFLGQILNNFDFASQLQDQSKSTYFPRLNTERHGYIDWTWSASQINSFICAFDEPYAGASTFFKSKRIFLKDSMYDPTIKSFHPFQAGLVYRKHNESLYIAALEGSLVVKQVLDSDGNNLMDKIKPGHRLTTPKELLEKALEEFTIYTSEGLKNT